MDRLNLFDRWNGDNGRVQPHELLFIRKKPTLLATEDGKRETFFQSTLRILTSKTIVLYFAIFILILIILTGIDMFLFVLNAGKRVSLSGDIFLNRIDLTTNFDISTPMSSYLSSFLLSDGECDILYGEQIAELQFSIIQLESHPSRINVKTKLQNTNYHGLRALLWDEISMAYTSTVTEFQCSTAITIRSWGFLYFGPIPISQSFQNPSNNRKSKRKKGKEKKKRHLLQNFQPLQHNDKKVKSEENTDSYSFQVILGKNLILLKLNKANFTTFYMVYRLSFI